MSLKSITESMNYTNLHVLHVWILLLFGHNFLFGVFLYHRVRHSMEHFPLTLRIILTLLIITGQNN